MWLRVPTNDTIYTTNTYVTCSVICAPQRPHSTHHRNRTPRSSTYHHRIIHIFIYIRYGILAWLTHHQHTYKHRSATTTILKPRQRQRKRFESLYVDTLRGNKRARGGIVGEITYCIAIRRTYASGGFGLRGALNCYQCRNCGHLGRTNI